MNEVGTRAIEQPTDFTFPDQEAASPPILFLSLFSRQGKVKENRERRRERHQGVEKSDPRICGRGGEGIPLSSPQISSSTLFFLLPKPFSRFLLFENSSPQSFFSPIVLLQREFYFRFLVIILFIPENFKFSLNRIQLVPSSPISLIYIYIYKRSIDSGERRGKRSGCSPPPPPARMNKRQSVYRGIHADKSYRGSDRDACRENGGPNRDAATAPLPLPRAEVGSMDRFNAEFNVLCSVFERFGAIRRRGSRTNTPSSSNPDRGVLFHLSIHPSVPLHLPPPRPCLSVSPGSGQRTRQAGQRT